MQSLLTNVNRKHEKRHLRPWGCTHINCSKSFGSKNDWKRHENSQHYQLEMWRCNERNPKSKINQCAKLCFRHDEFQLHLKKDHGLKDDNYVREQCKETRIGTNGQNSFWCGFCKRIVRLESRGLEAWDERFNHIDQHFSKHEQKIDNWYEVDKDIPKGSLRPGSLHDSERVSVANDDTQSENSEPSEAWEPASHRRRPPPPPPPPPSPPQHPPQPQPPHPPHTTLRQVPSPAIYPVNAQQQARQGCRIIPSANTSQQGHKKHPKDHWYCVSLLGSL